MPESNSAPYVILIKFPTRSRPDKFRDCLNEMIELAEDLDHIHFLVTIDDNDHTMQWALKAKFPPYVTVMSGKSNNKVHAINRDMHKAPVKWDICVQTSDDMKWIRKGWDTQIRSDMAKHFPDLSGALHYPDGYANERVITLTIVGKKWFDEMGYLYHPSYISLYSDDELTAVAKKKNKYAYIECTLFLHQHQFWLNTPKDKLLIYTQSFEPVDKANFLKREAINFDLPIPVTDESDS